MDRRIKSGGDIGEAERTHHRRSYCVDPTGVAHLRWLTSSALGVAAARAEVAAFLADQAGAAALGALAEAGAAVRAAQVHHRALLLAGQGPPPLPEADLDHTALDTATHGRHQRRHVAAPHHAARARVAPRLPPP